MYGGQLLFILIGSLGNFCICGNVCDQLLSVSYCSPGIETYKGFYQATSFGRSTPSEGPWFYWDSKICYWGLPHLQCLNFMFLISLLSILSLENTSPLNNARSYTYASCSCQLLSHPLRGIFENYSSHYSQIKITRLLPPLLPSPLILRSAMSYSSFSDLLFFDPPFPTSHSSALHSPSIFRPCSIISSKGDQSSHPASTSTKPQIKVVTKHLVLRLYSLSH